MPEPVIDFSEYTYLEENDFNEMAQRRHELSTEIKERDVELKRLNLEMAMMLTVADVQKVWCDGLTVSLVEGRVSKKLDKHKLIEFGVSAAVIEKATVESKGNPYIKVTQSRERE